MSDGEDKPVRPQSPFVSNLRMQVALARQPQQWELNPSIGTWLTPRSALRAQRPAGSGRPEHDHGHRISFSQEKDIVPITHRDDHHVMLELLFKGTCAQPFKLEDVDASITVLELKGLCEQHCLLPAEQQRLLYKGVLLHDSQKLEDTRVPDRGTIFLVKGASTNATPKNEEQSEEREPEVRSQGIWCIECGVNPGRLLTDGMCSICFRELVVKENAEIKKRREEAKRREEETARLEEERKREEEEKEAKRQKNTTRCYECNRKTGLTGFQCKCGYYFCATHRHAEDHACTFDHKVHGRQILSMQNPKVNGTWE